MSSHTRRSQNTLKKSIAAVFMVIKKKREINEDFLCKFNKCRKVFTERTSYLSHKLEHSSKKYYKCYAKDCTLSYRQPSSLKKHLRLHFNAETEGFTCCYCPVSFSKYTTLLVHLRSHDENGTLQKKRMFSTDRESKYDSSDDPILNSTLSTDNASIDAGFEHKNITESDSFSHTNRDLQSISAYYDVELVLNQLNSFVSYASSQFAFNSSGSFFSEILFK